MKRLVQDLPPRVVFGAATPNPALAHELSDALRSRLAPGGGDVPIDVDCRGRLCALSVRGPEAASELRWNCDEQTNPLRCWGQLRRDGWLVRAAQDRSLWKTFEYVQAPTRVGSEEQPALVRVRPEQARTGRTVGELLAQIAAEHDFAGVVASCEARHPAQGVLLVTAHVPSTIVPEETTGPRKIVVEYGGPLFGTPVARCLTEATQRILSEFEVPDGVFGGLGEWRLGFPHPKIELTALDGLTGAPAR